MKRKQSSWHVPSSDLSKRCRNPIRNIVEDLQLNPNPDKPLIALSVGDPTVFGNLRVSQQIISEVITSIESLKFNGYAPSTGYDSAKAAVARFVSCPGSVYEAKDVILCSGCSHSLELAISVLVNPGQNILVPRPGFPIYKMIAECMGFEYKFYNLVPEMNWLADLSHLESLIDSNTAAIVVNNPSNPCGSVFPKEHIKDILAIAARHYLPIIADEIYDNFVFGERAYHSFASLSTEVPVLSCGGLTKKFLVPGWRIGWITVHDKQGVLGEVRKGLQALSQRLLGCNTLVQGALPAILDKTPQSFFDKTLATIKASADLAFESLSQVPGLTPILPLGGMFMMVKVDMARFPGFKNEFQFVEQMVSEQSVFCLPGVAFDIPGFVRLALTIPVEAMEEACSRISEFCTNHFCPLPMSETNGNEQYDTHHQLLMAVSTLNCNGTNNRKLQDIVPIQNHHLPKPASTVTG